MKCYLSLCVDMVYHTIVWPMEPMLQISVKYELGDIVVGATHQAWAEGNNAYQVSMSNNTSSAIC